MSDPAQLVVDGRIVRRLIKRQRQLSGVAHVPHDHCAAGERAELLAVATAEELGLGAGPVPEAAVLIARDEEQGPEQRWRRAFHGQVHLAMDRRRRSGVLSEAAVRERIHRIGQTEFDEIRAVLKQEDLVASVRDDVEVYVEFAATYLELRAFDAEGVPRNFPTLRDHDAVAATLSLDVDAAALLAASRPEGQPERGLGAVKVVEGDEHQIETRPPAPAPPGEGERAGLLLQVTVARQRGNLARAAIASYRAAMGRGGEGAERADAEALGRRLLATVEQPESELGAWVELLGALARSAGAQAELAYGREAQVLMDLQKACLEHEQPRRTVDVMGWALSGGRRSVVRELPAARLVTIARYLRQARVRSGQAQLATELRTRLQARLDEASKAADRRLRQHIGAPIRQALEAVGLRPGNAPERVALRKLVDELLDQATSRGFLTFGQLRDSISRSNLKLPDLSGPGEWWRGDALLQADRRLAEALDGVYRHSEVYLRALQKVSSLFFGTRVGRGLTLHLLLPTLVAFVALSGVQHLVHPIAARIERSQQRAAAAADVAHGVAQGAVRAVSEAAGGDLDAAASAAAAATSAADAAAAAAARAAASAAAQAAHAAQAVASAAVHPADAAAAAASRAAQGAQRRDEHGDGARGPRREGHEGGHGPRLLTPWSLALLALFIYGLIHSVRFRRGVGAALHAVGSALHACFVGLPRWLYHLGPVQALLHSAPVRLFWRYLLKPNLAVAPVFLLLRPLHLPLAQRLVACAGVFVALTVAMNTPLGVMVQEQLTDWFARQWRFVSNRVLPGLFALIADFSHRLVEGVDQLLYAVDERLRFRHGDSRAAVALKGAAGVVWFFVTYFVRLGVNVFFEPQVNPIKHFPVVTVSHKLMLPTLTPALASALQQVGFSEAKALSVAVPVVGVLPGAVGFLVWELKGNWDLYAHNRPVALRPVLVGHHGETLGALLRPGFHSGTVPKLYAKMRRAIRHGESEAGKFREQLRDVEHAIASFVERELVALLQETEAWSAGAVAVGGVEVGSNRIRVELLCPSVDPKPAWLHFEEQSGWVVSHMAERGWIDRLDAEQRALFEAALAGVYRLAGVDISREQVEARLDGAPPYDVSDEGLVVWPDGDYQAELVYPLGVEGKVEPRVRGRAPSKPPSALDSDDLLLSRQALPWASWVELWSRPAEAPGALPSLRRSSLLPPLPSR